MGVPSLLWTPAVIHIHVPTPKPTHTKNKNKNPQTNNLKNLSNVLIFQAHKLFYLDATFSVSNP